MIEMIYKNFGDDIELYSAEPLKLIRRMMKRLEQTLDAVPERLERIRTASLTAAALGHSDEVAVAIEMNESKVVIELFLPKEQFIASSALLGQLLTLSDGCSFGHGEDYGSELALELVYPIFAHI